MFISQYVCLVAFTLLYLVSSLNTECSAFHISSHFTRRIKRQSCEFRCLNGQCIYRHQHCDGKSDCLDNWDEYPDICAASTQSVTPPILPVSSCALPSQPANGNYTVERLQSLIKLTYSCPSGYQIYPSLNNNAAICDSGKWYPGLFQCLRTCAPRISDSVDTYCEHNGIAMDCSKPMVEGTTVRMNCKHSYSQVDPSANRVSMCKNGSWDYKFIKCVPGQTRAPPVSSCALPSQPANGKYIVERLQSLIKLTFSCSSGYQIYPFLNNNVAICDSDKWYPGLFECVRTCGPCISDSVDTYCEYKGIKVDCSKLMIEGTIVRMNCKRLYSQTNLSANLVSVCKDGSWDYAFIECVPVNSCTLQSNNATGQCVLLKNCPKAIENLQKGIYPQICGYEGTESVVCCAKREVGDISKEKCKEYGEKVFTLEYPNIFDIDVTPIKTDTCRVIDASIKYPDNLKFANPKEFPHMALLGYGERNNIYWRCSGTVISEQFVLTSGLCLESRDFGPLRWIRVGELVLGTNTDDAQPKDFSVLESIKHPQYLPPSVYNDIALVKVNGQISFNPYVRPACLHTTTFINATRYVTTGWGPSALSHYERSDALQKVIVDSFSQDSCNILHQYLPNRILKYGIVPETQICASSIIYAFDMCEVTAVDDDGLIAASNESDVQNLLSHLQEKYELTINKPSHLLRMTISREADGSTYIHQEAYAHVLFKRFDITDAIQYQLQQK